LHARLHARIQSRFGDMFEGDGADRYDEHHRRLRPIHTAVARRAVALLPAGGRYLDIGTGPGALPALVAAARPDVTVTGVDVSQRMVELAAARLAVVTGADRGRVVLGDAAALPLPDGCADLVTAVLTTHHWQHLAAGAAELRRVTAPGGAVLIVEVRGPARHVARTLRQAGFVVGRENAWAYALPFARLIARVPA